MVLLVPTLGACGFGYQTDQVYQPGVGVNNRDGSVDVLGAVVVSSTDGEGTFVASLVNKSDTDDSLESMTGEDVQVQLSAPVEVKADTLVNLADTGAVSVTGENVAPGKFVRLTLQFEGGQTTEVNVPVVPGRGRVLRRRARQPREREQPLPQPESLTTCVTGWRPRERDRHCRAPPRGTGPTKVTDRSRCCVHPGGVGAP